MWITGDSSSSALLPVAGKFLLSRGGGNDDDNGGGRLFDQRDMNPLKLEIIWRLKQWGRSVALEPRAPADLPFYQRA